MLNKCYLCIDAARVVMEVFLNCFFEIKADMNLASVKTCHTLLFCDIKIFQLNLKDLTDIN